MWLEGAILHQAGFHRGVPYNVAMTADAITFAVDHMAGKRRVSGKTKAGSDWAIIDMNGANLAPFANRPLTLRASSGIITITKTEADECNGECIRQFGVCRHGRK